MKTPARPAVVLLCFLMMSPFAALAANPWLAAAETIEVAALKLPKPGDYGLRVISPEWLEMARVTRKESGETPLDIWDFADEAKRPAPADFEVTVNGTPVAVEAVSFKRRVLYAPLKVRDLRVGIWLYLKLAAPVPDGAEVKVASKREGVIPPGEAWAARAEAWRFNPALHVNQDAYPAAGAKLGYAGYYLGSAGELPIAAQKFSLVDLATGEAAFEGALVPRLDKGFGQPAYQNVLAADFSEFTKPGHYVLAVPGMGASLPFWIDADGAGLMARTYALGIYHQQDGAPGTLLPFTRFTQGPSHAAPAKIITPESPHNKSIGGTSADAVKDPKHTAPIMKSAADSLYPIIKTGEVDVSGGHHDAGDYSKYTINSASFIHYLIFAADSFPGVAELDNLGIPESGDGISDMIQMAKWESDFLVKMQDDDGGFFFLVYPRERKYEDDVTPDLGDPQIVYPKNTAVTAAAVAALAQAATSPAFKKAYPKEAEKYLAAAKKGWDFLQNAIAKYGWDGSYQKITHYGDLFRHDDELVWAAVQMFLATGDPKIQEDLKAHFDPKSRDVKRWGWWRLPEAYGNAMRSYVFGPRTGRQPAEKFDAAFLEACTSELTAGAEDELRRAEDCAYGVSFPGESKAFMNAGWFFGGDRALDLAVGQVLAPKPAYLRAIATNLGYEAGANPINMPRITGVGAFQQRDIVHQHSQNDWRELPVSGIPLGALQGGFMWLNRYQKELGQTSFPSDGSKVAPYPLYDRWGDSFNVNTEFVVINQARGMAASALLMAQAPTQPWKSVPATIKGFPADAKPGQTVSLTLDSSVDLTRARIIWEATGHELFEGPEFAFTQKAPGDFQIEVEALLPDGRRVFAEKRGRMHDGEGGKPSVRGPATVALLEFDKPITAEALRAATGLETTIAGNPAPDPAETFWMQSPSGSSLKLSSYDDCITLAIPSAVNSGFKLSAWMKIAKVPTGRNDNFLLAVVEGKAPYGLMQAKWTENRAPNHPYFLANKQAVFPGIELIKSLTPNSWHRVTIEYAGDRMTCSVDGRQVVQKDGLQPWSKDAPKALVLGHFIGWIDDVHLESL
ncbi:MAG: glycoside hydrolase family 9 protein [Verrucomicrobiae bacterium]